MSRGISKNIEIRKVKLKTARILFLYFLSHARGHTKTTVELSKQIGYSPRQPKPVRSWISTTDIDRTVQDAVQDVTKVRSHGNAAISIHVVLNSRIACFQWTLIRPVFGSSSLCRLRRT